MDTNATALPVDILQFQQLLKYPSIVGICNMVIRIKGEILQSHTVNIFKFGLSEIKNLVS